MSLVLVLLLLCAAVHVATTEVLFRTGFEPGITIEPKSAKIDVFAGLDTSVDPPNDVAAFNADPHIGKFKIYYEGGEPSQREASIQPAEEGRPGHVLRFELFEANVPALGKGRIQAAIAGCKDVYTFGVAVSVFLAGGFALLSASPSKITWLTIFELWNNESAGPYPFRISVGVHKRAGEGSPLYWGLHGQKKDVDASGLPSSDKWIDVWKYDAPESVPVPVNEWAELRYEFVEGDARTGRFKLTIAVSGGADEVTIADQVGYTYHPADPSPDGVNAINPMKLYTSAGLLDGVKAAGKTMVALFDDFSFSVSATTASSSKLCERDFGSSWAPCVDDVCDEGDAPSEACYNQIVANDVKALCGCSSSGKTATSTPTASPTSSSPSVAATTTKRPTTSTIVANAGHGSAAPAQTLPAACVFFVALVLGALPTIVL